MPLARLEVIAAGIETDAFADQRDFGAAAPDQFDQARLPRRALTHGMDQRIVFFQRGTADDTEFGAMLFGEGGCGGGQLVRAHIVGGRVDQIAGEKYARCNAADFIAVHARRQRQFGGAFGRLLVAGELIKPVQPGQRGLIAAAEIGHLAETVGAVGQAFRKRRQRKCVGVFAKPQHGAGKTDFTGQQPQFPFFCGEAAGLQIGVFGEKAIYVLCRHGMERNGSLRGFRKARMHEWVLPESAGDFMNAEPACQGAAARKSVGGQAA